MNEIKKWFDTPEEVLDFFNRKYNKDLSYGYELKLVADALSSIGDRKFDMKYIEITDSSFAYISVVDAIALKFLNDSDHIATLDKNIEMLKEFSSQLFNEEGCVERINNRDEMLTSLTNNELAGILLTVVGIKDTVLYFNIIKKLLIQLYDERSKV